MTFKKIELATIAVDMCRCSTCENVHELKDCEHVYGHHGGYERPAYTEVICPTCEDGGCVDDLFSSLQAKRDSLTDEANDVLDTDSKYFYGSLQGVESGRDLVEFLERNKEFITKVYGVLE